MINLLQINSYKLNSIHYFTTNLNGVFDILFSNEKKKILSEDKDTVCISEVYISNSFISKEPQILNKTEFIFKSHNLKDCSDNKS